VGVFLLILRLSRGYSTPQGEQWTFARLVMTASECSSGLSLHSEQPTQNWSGQVLPDRILLYTEKGEELLTKIVDAGLHPVTSLVRRSSLEDVFLRLTGRTLVE